MKRKRIRTMTITMTTALGVSAILFSATIHGQEPETAVVQEENTEKQAQPEIALQKQLQGEHNTYAETIIGSLNTSIRAYEHTLIKASATNNIAKSTGEVEINANDFPDAEFRNYLLTKFDKDGDNKIAIASVTKIAIRGKKNITDLTGIEKFTDLESLDCSNSGINSLDVRNNIALIELNCSNTNIKDLDIRNNIHLQKLYCYVTKIENLDVRYNPELTYFDCSNTGITSLNVSNNLFLESLFCNNTKISSLDISKNALLKTLHCSSTYINDLNISKNPLLQILFCNFTDISDLDIRNNLLLKSLYCSYTDITVLDVSQHTDLEYLNCSYTKIAILDISSSTKLKELDIRHTNLAFLDWGQADVKTLYQDTSSATINLAVTSDTLDITQAFPGIDIHKLNNMHGGTLKGNNITNYTVGTPITYTYNCGTYNGTMITLNVILNLSKSDSTIEFVGMLDMEYTGQPIIPSINKSGSQGKVTFTYEVWNGSTWVPYHDIPSNVGKYRIRAYLEEDDYCKSTETTKEFAIAQATNEWIVQLAIADWTYGEKSNTPAATSKYGTAAFTYSDEKDGTYTNQVPTNAGTWYVKAVVEGTDNYTGLEYSTMFTILPKDMDHIMISTITKDEDVDNLIIKDGDKLLVKDLDYIVSKKQENKEVTITIIFQGNYTGIITRNYTIATEKPKDIVKDTDSLLSDSHMHFGLIAAMSIVCTGCFTLLTEKRRKKTGNR